MFYARYMYHATCAPKVIESQEELDALNDEWAESPDAAMEIARRPPAKVVLTDAVTGVSITPVTDTPVTEDLTGAVITIADADPDAEARKALEDIVAGAK